MGAVMAEMQKNEGMANSAIHPRCPHDLIGQHRIIVKKMISGTKVWRTVISDDIVVPAGSAREGVICLALMAVAAKTMASSCLSSTEIVAT